MDVLQYLFRCYWPTFYFICFILHFTMYFLIYHRTTRVLNRLRFFLYPATTANFLLATLAFSTQVRNVNNKQSMALLCDGLCKFLGPSFCFHSYVLLLTMVTVTGLINLHTLCYRTMSLKYLDPKKSERQTLLYSFHYLIPLTTFILSHVPTQNHPSVYMETRFLHPDYNLKQYLNFGGFADSHHFCMNFNTITLALTTIYVPIIGMSWKNCAMKILRSNISSVTSNSTSNIFETLIKGLSLQVLLPLCCYVPVTILYCYNKYSGVQILVSQYTLSFLGSLPCIFDPLIQIYFIVPYRTSILKFFARNPPGPSDRASEEQESTSLIRYFLKLIGKEKRRSVAVQRSPSI